MKKSFLSTRNGSDVKGNRAFSPAGIAATMGQSTRGLSAEAAVANDGSINAVSKKDLMAVAGLLASAAGCGEIVEASASEEQIATAAEARASLQMAFAGDEQTWTAVGEYLGNEVVQTMGRTGFARKLLQFSALGKGEVPRVRFRERDTDVHFISNGGTTVASMPRQQFEYPSVYTLTAAVNISEQELALDPGDLLDDRYNDCLEQLMVGEDRNWKRLADTVAPIFNPQVFFPSLTPAVFVSMQNEVEKWGGLPVASAVVAIDLWNDIKTDSEFIAWWSEIEKHEIAIEGKIGRIGGIDIITDGWRLPRFQVLDAGEIYMVAHPKTHGLLQQLGELSVNATNQYNLGRLERGWLMGQMETMTLPNAYAVVKGQRT